MSSMFRTRRKPADTPFIHGPDCKMKDASPQWSFIPGSGGQWERVCRCHREAVTVLDEVLDPNSAAAEPAWTAHEHAVGCEASGVASVVRVEKREAGTGWRSTCLACGTLCVYFYDAERVDATGRPISREGDVRYQYELKHQTVAV
jgi:hypothetical protein